MRKKKKKMKAHLSEMDFLREKDFHFQCCSKRETKVYKTESFIQFTNLYTRTVSGKGVFSREVSLFQGCGVGLNLFLWY